MKTKEITKNKEADKRNYGIDLLRIVSMLFVVTLHTLGHGAILRNTIVNSSQYNFAWSLEIISYCAVDIFALISGYVTFTDKEKKYKISKYIDLWFEVVFYGLLSIGIFLIINPSIVAKKDLLTAAFPVMFNAYWYFSAYTALFIFIPFINKAIRNTDPKTLKRLFIVIFLFFSLSESVKSKFGMSGGYTFIWITLLYIMGAIIKKTEMGKNIKKYILLIGIIILYAITYIYKLTINGNLLISYISPTLLGVSILYIMLFAKLNFNNVVNKIIKFLAPSTFAIYIINENNLLRDNYIRDNFAFVANYHPINLVGFVLGFSILFVIGSILIDKIRIQLFKLFRVDKLSSTIETVLDKTSSKLIK